MLVVFHSGRLHCGHLPLRFSFVDDKLSFRLSSIEPVFHWWVGGGPEFFDGRELGEGVKCFLDFRNCAIRFLLDYEQQIYFSGAGGGRVCKMKLRLTPSSSAEAGVGLSLAKVFYYSKIS